MDLDLFLGTPRWKILEILAKKPSSPIEIAKILQTSVAYVSQQLKLLEAANLIKKEKTKASEKGKPRTIYSLSQEVLHLTALVKNYPIKKSIFLTNYHKLILRIWFLEDAELHYLIEKLYWKIEDIINEIEGIFFLAQEKPKVLIVTNSKKVRPRIELYLKEISNRLTCTIISTSDLEKYLPSALYPIHDPSSLLLGKELKGGEK